MPARKGITRILVPLDGSEYGERALPWAIALAGAHTELLLIEVVPIAREIRAFRGEIIGSTETIRDGYRQLAEDQLAHAREKWLAGRKNVSTQIAEGDPAEQILATAQNEKADLIVMSSHGRGAVGRFVSGSVADRIVRDSPLPVMVIGPEGEIADHEEIKRVVAPIDSSPLSLAALPVAGRIGRLAEAPVRVVHVVTPATQETSLIPGVMGSIPPNYFEEIYDEGIDEGKQLVDRAVKFLEDQGADATGEVFSGVVNDSILGSVQAGDVLVLSSHARGGLARWVIGSTALKLIRNGAAPVVVVSPGYADAHKDDTAALSSELPPEP